MKVCAVSRLKVALQVSEWHHSLVLKSENIAQVGRISSILPWRVVAGIFLHFLLPFYLIALIIDVLLEAGGKRDVEAMLQHALAATPFILGGYAALATAAVVAASMLDPLLRVRRHRMLARNPHHRHLEMSDSTRLSLDRCMGRFGPRSDAALARLQASRWYYSDLGQQSLARDLVEAADASCAAFDTAAPERRQIIIDTAAATFERLADAQAELATARGLRKERYAQAISGYVERRYGHSDFSGSGD